ncbi:MULTISPECIES: YbgA family protein [unclassified Nonomuraea]|uniref:YbgA family protein n=1 Tax=unclassified Nonomuraea TaxID=2593643 RepID=UPI0035C0A347
MIATPGRTGTPAERPRLAISSCLLGRPVRHDGRHNLDRFLTETLAPYVDWLPVCPEVEAGLGTPREALWQVSTAQGPRLVTRMSRVDLTGRMTAVADRRAAQLDIDGYVFKAKTPTCGIHGVPRHGNDGVDQRNRGLFAGIVMERHPLLPVEDEGRLRDPRLRADFVERVFAHARLRTFLDGDWRPRDLVAFHARHKMQLLAHDPALYREAGRVVAGAGARPREEVAADYAEVFGRTMTARTTTGRNVNVLQHCLGMLALDPARRADLVEVIDSYRAGLVPLDVPVRLMRHHARGESAAYVRDQTYLTPYPDALRE